MSKRYSDREVSLILQKALDPAAMESVPGDSGLTLEEIKDVATEVGIDPVRIELAAANLTGPSLGPVNPYAGIPTVVQFETLLPGVVVDRVPRHDFLDIIRASLGRQGIVEESAGSLGWKARDASGGRYVTLAPTADGARLRVLGNYRDGLLMLVGVVGVIVFGIMSVVLEAAGVGPGLSIGLSALAALIPPPFAYRFWRRGEDARMASLHGKLLARLRDDGEG